MTTSEVLGTAALVAGLLMAISPALQIRRMLHTRSSRAYSLAYPALLSAGFVLWLAYGISIWNPPMMISNVVQNLFGTSDDRPLGSAIGIVMLVVVIVVLEATGRAERSFSSLDSGARSGKAVV